MALGDNPTKTYKVIDNASSTLASGISAGATIASLNTGDGALFPTTYNGTATSAGDNTTLNSTGIGATGFAVGDQIYNVTDGSWATVVTINTNDIVTTELRGGSGNTWDNSDEWVVNPFVVTFVQYSTTGDQTTAVVKREKVLVKYRSTDDLYIGTRAFDGTSATAFDSGDNVYVFVEQATIETMNAALRQMQYEIERTVTGDGARGLDNNTFLKGTDAAGTGTVDIIKVDGSDNAVFGVVPQLPAGRTITNNQDVIDKEYFDVNAATASFGGDGADGAIDGTANETITGSNDTYIVKNYSSWAAASGGTKTCTVTPTGCIVHIKIQGDADFTDWTFDFDGKGASGPGGGAGGAPSSDAGNTGASSSINWGLIAANAGGGGGAYDSSGSNGSGGGGGGAGGSSIDTAGSDGNAGSSGGTAAGGTAGSAMADATAFMNLNSGTILSSKSLFFVRPGMAGSGGGGGGADSGGPGNGGAGGIGGAGGGCLIIEVSGDLTFSSTTMTLDGDAGSVGGDATGSLVSGAPGGGGGGGAGGTLVVLYNGALSGSPTTSFAGGTGGAGGTVGVGSSYGNGGAGGAGATGNGFVAQNTAFN